MHVDNLDLLKRFLQERPISSEASVALVKVKEEIAKLPPLNPKAVEGEQLAAASLFQQLSLYKFARASGTHSHKIERLESDLIRTSKNLVSLIHKSSHESRIPPKDRENIMRLFTAHNRIDEITKKLTKLKQLNPDQILKIKNALIQWACSEENFSSLMNHKNIPQSFQKATKDLEAALTDEELQSEEEALVIFERRCEKALSNISWRDIPRFEKHINKVKKQMVAQMNEELEQHAKVSIESPAITEEDFSSRSSSSLDSSTTASPTTTPRSPISESDFSAEDNSPKSESRPAGVRFRELSDFSSDEDNSPKSESRQTVRFRTLKKEKPKKQQEAIRIHAKKPEVKP